MSGPSKPLSEDFQELMEQIRAGSESAARELFERYRGYILRVVRRRLPKVLRLRFDSADLEQAVWASIFRRREEIFQFDGPDMMVKFLNAVAARKTITEIRRYLTTGKHNLNRVQSMHSPEIEEQLSDAEASSPTEDVDQADMEEYIANRKSQRERRILQLLLKGHTFEEIAEEIGVTERQVRRILKRVEAHVKTEQSPSPTN